jgi:hypothetical protein
LRHSLCLDFDRRSRSLARITAICSSVNGGLPRSKTAIVALMQSNATTTIAAAQPIMITAFIPGSIEILMKTDPLGANRDHTVDRPRDP